MDRGRAEVPEHLRVRPFTLPEVRRTYSVTRVYRVQPGDVLVALDAWDVSGARGSVFQRGDAGRLCVHVNFDSNISPCAVGACRQ
jgi:hypothetical protein